MKPRNLVDINERFQTRHALREERELNTFRAAIQGPVAPLGPDENDGTGKRRFATEGVRVLTDSHRDLAFWFAVLSPLLGILVGFLALLLFYH
jgi:hypothetical protein